MLDPNTPAPVTLYKTALETPQRLSFDVLMPRAIKDNFHNWEKELFGASMVNIHSKVTVLDPFGANPVLMTGSHNLGSKASDANDDDLVIIEGNGPLAAVYAINIIAIFQNYRWNSYVEAHRDDPKVWHGLVDNGHWQASHLAGSDLAELTFWPGEAPKTSAATTRGSPKECRQVPLDQCAPKSMQCRRMVRKCPDRHRQATQQENGPDCEVITSTCLKPVCTRSRKRRKRGYWPIRLSATHCCAKAFIESFVIYYTPHPHPNLPPERGKERIPSPGQGEG